MNWYQLYKLAQAGYGAWISPSGGLIDVDSMFGHHTSAEKILRMLKGEDDDKNNMGEYNADMLMEMGYVRVVYMPFNVESYNPLTSKQKKAVLNIIRNSESASFYFSSRSNRIEDGAYDKVSARELARRM
jgi:hypothetical protein